MKFCNRWTLIKGNFKKGILGKLDFGYMEFWKNGILDKCFFVILGFNLNFFYKNNPLCMSGAAKDANDVIPCMHLT